MSHQSFFDKTFKDKSGKVVLWQTPNWPIISWAFFRVLNYIGFSKPIHNLFDFIASASLFMWAALEISSGVNYFRRILGVVVLAVLLFGIYTK